MAALPADSTVVVAADSMVAAVVVASTVVTVVADTGKSSPRLNVKAAAGFIPAAALYWWVIHQTIVRGSVHS
jgi:hypothetical protein